MSAPHTAIEVCTRYRNNTEERGEIVWKGQKEYHRVVHMSKFLKDEQKFAK